MRAQSGRLDQVARRGARNEHRAAVVELPDPVAAGREPEDTNGAHRSPSSRARWSQAPSPASSAETAGRRVRRAWSSASAAATASRRMSSGDGDGWLQVGAALEELDVEIAVLECGVGQQAPVEALVGGHAERR